MIRTIAAGLAALVIAACETFAPPPEARPATTSDFTFESGGNILSGVMDVPASGEAEALVIFIHGYGGTDIRGQNKYAGLRERFNRLGITTVTWDKPGQGESGGEFDINQPVHDSAQEVLDAAGWLREQAIPGAERIGLWGLSRGGWIAPIALSQDPDMEFWISVGGVTAEDNYQYLIISNLPHEGYSEDEARTIDAEWRAGFKVFSSGGSFEAYESATPTLRANEYVTRMMGPNYTREAYEMEQQGFLSMPPEMRRQNFDPETGMSVNIQDFGKMLSGLDIDVLAVFGEKDLNVDWCKTRALYEETIGQNPEASLRVETFPDANHNLDTAETGSIGEMQAMESRSKVDGYYDVQAEWLKEVVLE